MFIRNNFNRLIILFKRIKLKNIIKYKIKKSYIININL